MQIGDFNPMDRRFWSKNPEPGFSVARNKWVIKESIRKNEEMRKKKEKEFADALGERTEAAAWYLGGINGAERSRTIERYFGKTELAHLRGQEIANQLIHKQSMFIKTPDEKYREQLAQKELAKTVVEGVVEKKKGKVFEIKRSHAEEAK